MMRLDLSREEAGFLATLLERELSDLSYEIANTDSLDYRQGLKQKRDSLRHVLGELRIDRQAV